MPRRDRLQSITAGAITTEITRRGQERDRKERPMTKAQFRWAVMRDLGYTEDEILDYAREAKEDY